MKTTYNPGTILELKYKGGIEGKFKILQEYKYFYLTESVSGKYKLCVSKKDFCEDNTDLMKCSVIKKAA